MALHISQTELSNSASVIGSLHRLTFDGRDVHKHGNTAEAIKNTIINNIERYYSAWLALSDGDLQQAQTLLQDIDYRKPVAVTDRGTFIEQMLQSASTADTYTDAEQTTAERAIYIQTLGQFTIEIDNNTSTIKRKASAKPMDLLKCLLSFGGKQVSQEKIIEALWPDAIGDNAQNVFNTTLCRLRKFLKYKNAITLKNGLLSLNTALIQVDIWALEQDFSEIEKLLSLADEQSKASVMTLQKRIIQSYREGFLYTDQDRPWTLQKKQRVHKQMIAVLQKLGQYWLGCGKLSLGIDCYAKGIEIEPTNEEFYQLLMKAYKAKGKYADAANTFAQCRHNLTTHLRISPSSKTVSIYKSIMDGSAKA